MSCVFCLKIGIGERDRELKIGIGERDRELKGEGGKPKSHGHGAAK